MTILFKCWNNHQGQVKDLRYNWENNVGSWRFNCSRCGKQYKCVRRIEYSVINETVQKNILDVIISVPRTRYVPVVVIDKITDDKFVPYNNRTVKYE